MKKLLLILLLCATGFGQFVEVKKPDTYLGEIRQLYSQENRYILVHSVIGPRSLLFRSSDNGISWSVVFEQTSKFIKEFSMTDSVTGFLRVTRPYADTEDISIYKTTNGGVSWQVIYSVSPHLAKSSNLLFINSLTGFFYGPDKKLHSTSDGGETWVKDSIPFLFERNVKVFGLSRDLFAPVFLMATYDSLFFASSVHGQWFSVPNQYNLYSGAGLKFHTAKGKTVFTNGTNRIYYQNYDGGFAYKDFPELMAKAFVISSSASGIELIASSKFGDLYYFNSESNTLSYLHKIPEARIIYPENEIFVYDSSVYYATGRFNYIIKTTDAGSTWIDFYNTTTGLKNPVFNRLNGISFSEGNQINYTTNGGIDWNRSVLLTGESNYFNSGFAASSKVFYATGSQNGSSYGARVYKSTDGGRYWKMLNGINEPPILYAFNFFDENRGFAFGGESIFYTEDGGNSWLNTYTSSTGNISAIHFLNDSTGFAYCNGTTGSSSLLKSTNGGLNWNPIAPLPYYWVSKLYTVSVDTILMCTYDKLYKSTDGGLSFQEVIITSGFSFDINDFEVMGKSLCVIIRETESGSGEYLTYLSRDLGASWNQVSAGLTWVEKVNDYFAYGTSNNNQISKLHLNSRNVLGVNNYNALKNDTVTVEIMYSPSLNAAISAIQFEITGYGDKLQFLELDTVNTDLSAAGWMYAVNHSTGRIRLAMSGSKYLTFGGVLARVKYKVVDSTGTAPLNLTQVLFNTGIIATDTANGFVKIDRINPGDVDINGIVQAFDAGLVLKYLTKQVFLSDLQKRNANVTTDNEINAFDASVILRYVVGLITSLPYGGTDHSAADYVMDNFNALPGSIIEVPLNLVNASGIYSADGFFTYDPSKLTFTEVVWDARFSNFLKEVSAADGKINFAIAASQKKDLPSGMFAKIRFTVNNSAVTGSSTTVGLSKIRLNQNPASLSPVSSVISIVTSLTDTEGLPQEFELSQNFPNPFNPSTVIKYSVPVESRVRIRIFDISGALIAEPVNSRTAPGNYSLSIDLNGRSSGVYICRMEAGGTIMNIKMNLIK